MGGESRWSDLPPDLLIKIGNSLDTRIEVLRSRAVCKSWRSVITFSPLTFPLRFPPYYGRKRYLTVAEHTVCHLEQNRSGTSSSSSSNGFLFQVEEQEETPRMRLFPLFPRIPFEELHQTFSMGFSFLHSRISKIWKFYKPKSDGTNSTDRIRRIRNVAVERAGPDGFHILVLLESFLGRSHQLLLLTSGDERWTDITEQIGAINYFFHDLITHKGKFYALTRDSGAAMVDPSSKEVSVIAFSFCYIGVLTLVTLVESSDDLLLVYKMEYGADKCYFNVFKLDEEERRWIKMKNLGDRVLFICNDCSFSVSARIFAEYKENCIYFVDIGKNWCVFNLEDRGCYHLTRGTD